MGEARKVALEMQSAAMKTEETLRAVQNENGKLKESNDKLNAELGEVKKKKTQIFPLNRYQVVCY